MVATVRVIACGWLIGALTGCGAVTPRPELQQNIVEIDAADLPRYWMDANTQLESSVPAIQMPQVACGFVEIEFLIDSNGDVFEEELVESRPPGVWDQFALEVLAARRFEAAGSNPGRIPVRVNQRTFFNQDDVACKNPESE